MKRKKSDGSTIKTARAKEKRPRKFGCTETFTTVRFRWHALFSHTAFFFFFLNQMYCFVSNLQSKWHVDISIWHFCCLTEEIAMIGSIFPTSQLHSRWMSCNASFMGPCRWLPIQDLLLNNFSQREVIDCQGVLDAPRILSEHCPNNRVNEAQIGYEYKAISWICWTKIAVHLKAHLSVTLCF